jgi:endonuclease-3
VARRTAGSRAATKSPRKTHAATAAGRTRKTHAPTLAEVTERKKRARAIIRVLKRLYPETKTALRHANPFQLYVATVLSAQCTDQQVNRVTPALFSRYPTPQALAKAPRSAIETLIRSTGFFRNKAKNIQKGAQRVAEVFSGKLPETMEELLTLAGTGRKTANVILGSAFGIPGITVDTHVRRLSQRLGLTTQQDPVKIEFELMKILPKREWTDLSLRLIWHGRRVCGARKPRCGECVLLKLCPFGREALASQG